MESSKDLTGTILWKKFSAMQKTYNVLDNPDKDEGVEGGKREQGVDNTNKLDGFWNDIWAIKQDLSRIGEEIEIVKTVQEIKNVKTEKVEMYSKIFEAKLKKFEKRVWENDEKVKDADRKLGKIEKVLEEFSDFDRKIGALEDKHTEIEKAVNVYRKHSQQFFRL